MQVRHDGPPSGWSSSSIVFGRRSRRRRQQTYRRRTAAIKPMADGPNQSATSPATAGPLSWAETQARGADRKEERIGRVARPVADQEGDDRRRSDAAQSDQD